MSITHIPGFPRIGKQRELKKAVEAYWNGDLAESELKKIGKTLRARHWQQQADAGLDFVTVGDFSWYDQVLDMSATLGVVPPRFEWPGKSPTEAEPQVDLNTYFRMARGRAPEGKPAHACEMTKWFDTNYHYIVPEFYPEQAFSLCSTKLFDEIAEAQQLGYTVKPVILGPLSYLWLGKVKEGNFDKLNLLDKLLPWYQQILEKLQQQGIEWLQIDEPILVLDLPAAWQAAFQRAYATLQGSTLPNALLTTYFDDLGNNLSLACQLPVSGLHIDTTRGYTDIATLIEILPGEMILSLGLIDGRNIWKTDLNALIEFLTPIKEKLHDRLWLSSSCSLLHVPVDLEQENKLDPEIKSWLAFATQKLAEIQLLNSALNKGTKKEEKPLQLINDAIESRKNSQRTYSNHVRERVAGINESFVARKLPFPERIRLQHQQVELPLFPTTTIGSFPQTSNVRHIRQEYKQGIISEEVYREKLKQEIAFAIQKQEALGLDVLVHGEAERNDMVEYFGEQLSGFAFTEHGWVQSYGSRCVKPPIIYGDVARQKPMTLDWISYAQSLTDKPVKGMLTGPVTILNWSFVRNDLPLENICLQIALALRDEVMDLETAGTKIIQIDEAALREGLPLKKQQWAHYLKWAVKSFKVAASGVKDTTQIHTHMCYSEFNDIIQAVAAMDADVITIETSRSDMKLLDAFKDFSYPNDIGPGVYDIHSPNVPTVAEIVNLMHHAKDRIPLERLWINPDCGLKTRGWEEVEAALKNMVKAAKLLREQV